MIIITERNDKCSLQMMNWGVDDFLGIEGKLHELSRSAMNTYQL